MSMNTEIDNTGMPLRQASFGRRLNLRWIGIGLVAFAMTGFFQNCSSAKFGSNAASSDGDDSGNGDGNGNANGIGSGSGYGNGTATGGSLGVINQPNTNPNSCYTILHQISTPVKLLFVLDTSGSNSGASGTDPLRQVRGQSIQAFYSDYGAKPNFNWGMFTFAANVIHTLIGVNGVPNFSASSAAMQSAIAAFSAISDTGNTPYQLALNAANQALANDLGGATSDTKYIVVFMSDGIPNPDVPAATLAMDVQNLVNLRPGKITFNTIYYGPGDPVASGRLNNMAVAGGGSFLDTNANPTGRDFLISNFVSIPEVSCQH